MVTRPTTDNVKEAMFNLIQFDIEGGVLDLFAGTGQLGIEALSRGARSAVFVDESRAAVQLVRANLALCRLQGDVVQGESLGYLRTCGKFDLIFLDPPYDTGLLDKALENVVQFDILAEGGIIVCESRREKVLPQLRAPYHLFTERNYGKIKLTLLRKGNPRMKTAIYPGSFDPITLGHLNIIRRASGIFDRVVVCIMPNAGKLHAMFTREERVALARRVVSRFPNVEVDTFDGLLAEYAKTFPEGAVIVKGLRANTDFENEFQMALINKKINPELDTMFLTASQKYTFLSSSVVKELAGYGADLTPFVPCEIIDDVHERATRGE